MAVSQNGPLIVSTGIRLLLVALSDHLHDVAPPDQGGLGSPVVLDSLEQFPLVGPQALGQLAAVVLGLAGEPGELLPLLRGHHDQGVSQRLDDALDDALGVAERPVGLGAVEPVAVHGLHHDDLGVPGPDLLCELPPGDGLAAGLERHVDDFPEVPVDEEGERPGDTGVDAHDAGHSGFLPSSQAPNVATARALTTMAGPQSPVQAATMAITGSDSSVSGSRIGST